MFKSSRRSSPRSFRPTLESLDARIMPAVVLTKLDLDGDGAADDIRIVGDAQNSKVSFVDNGNDKLLIQIDANGDGDTADTSAGDLDIVHTFGGKSLVIEVSLKGGKDSIKYTATGTMDGVARSFHFDLGSGDDELTWNQPNLISTSSRIDMNVVGGGGNDLVSVKFEDVFKSVVSLNTDLGAGDDLYHLSLDEVDYEGSVDVRTELGKGNNINNSYLKSLGKFGRASLNMSVIGGPNTDNVLFRMQDDVGSGMSSSHLNVFVDLQAGNDVFQGLLAGGDFRVDDQSHASFIVRGGAGNDKLTMKRDGLGAIRMDPLAFMLVDLDGGAGNDEVIADFGGTDAFQIDTDGLLKIRLDGGAGKDKLVCLVSNDAATTGNYDLAVRGGEGDDSIEFALNNNGGTPKFGPSGRVLLDGGIGKDLLTNGNPILTFSVGFETVN